jgi:hypothetical protein
MYDSCTNSCEADSHNGTAIYYEFDDTQLEAIQDQTHQDDFRYDANILPSNALGPISNYGTTYPIGPTLLDSTMSLTETLDGNFLDELLYHNEHYMSSSADSTILDQHINYDTTTNYPLTHIFDGSLQSGMPAMKAMC